MVLSSKYTLWTVFAQAENYSPRRESSSLKRGYSRPGEEAPRASVLSRVLLLRREIFRPSDEVFSLRREYFRSGESIFAQAKIDLALWTTFAQAIIFFAQARGIFVRAKLVSPKLKKKIFFFFCFFFLNV